MSSAIVAAALYLIIAFLQSRRLRASRERSAAILGLSALAVLVHGYSAFLVIQSPAGVNLGFFKISSPIFFLINIYFLLNSLRRPLLNLLVILYPLSALSVLVSAAAPGNETPYESFSPGMLAHIGSSALAYAVLTIAACQAGAVAAMDYQLRHRHTHGLARLLPPLQLMETVLFELLWVGLVLLTVAIGSGMAFLEDMFAQSLAHKTVLTIAAWMLFATLLWGRHRLGWRSQTAVKFTLAGFAALMLGYFGSKLVLELVLERM